MIAHFSRQTTSFFLKTDQKVNLMNYPVAELRSIKMNFNLINPDAEHRGILLIKLTPHLPIG